VDVNEGIVTSTFDRVLLAYGHEPTGSREGEVMYSEYARLPGEKPTMDWSDNRLVISCSEGAEITFVVARVSEIEIVVRTRPAR
jgi:hypothetical protein